MTALGKGIRVKCIYDGSWLDPLGLPDSGPPFGSVWTVNIILKRWGNIYFTLAEWRTANQYFLSTEFVPLSGNEDISELEGLLNKGPVNEEELTVAERFLEYVNRDLVKQP